MQALKNTLFMGVVLTLSVLSMPSVGASTSPAVENTTADFVQALKPLSLAESKWLGAKIYYNEGRSSSKYLTYWGAGEEFASLGIGHFIWYPRQNSKQQPSHQFVESFPAMVAFVAQSHPPPLWLQELNPLVNPWNSKEAFDQAWAKPRLTSLRQWLLNTQGAQARFIEQQFKQRLIKQLKPLKPTQQEAYKRLIKALFRFKKGRFALIDYANFKGLGSPQEAYQGEQWGLLSVLEQILQRHSNAPKQLSEQALLNAFIKAAKQRLSLRTELAPAHRKEARWLPGWHRRLDGYKKESIQNE